jgi:LAO/AO transport system kinase
MSVSTPSLADRVRAADPRAVARAISIVEDAGGPASDLVAALHPHGGRAYVVGITGAPGAGKSTLVDALAGELRRGSRRVGILAVDPSSPFSGGAVLGDRVRMQRHASDPGVFIRSMAARGQLGGLARATGDAVVVLDAAGFDVVVIETVGVGQDEVEVARIVDVTVVVLVPGAGDSVQALKAGLMEIADIFVVNKADRPGADQVAADVRAVLSLASFDTGAWRPPVLPTDAIAGAGVAELVDALWRFREQAVTTLEARRRGRSAFRVREALASVLMQHVEASLGPGEIEAAVDEVAARRLDPYHAAQRLVSRLMPRDVNER